MYKITMNVGTDKWTVMDSDADYVQAKKYLDDWRNALKDREFRLELHTVTILDD